VVASVACVGISVPDCAAVLVQFVINGVTAVKKMRRKYRAEVT
jgi:hypothetical protein